jgi:hypothetical protein
MQFSILRRKENMLFIIRGSNFKVLEQWAIPHLQTLKERTMLISIGRWEFVQVK